MINADVFRFLISFLIWLDAHGHCRYSDSEVVDYEAIAAEYLKDGDVHGSLWYPNKGRETIDARELSDIDTEVRAGPGYHPEEIAPGVFEVCADWPTMEGPSLESMVADWEESRE
jgi:hypothetical protein